MNPALKPPQFLIVVDFPETIGPHEAVPSCSCGERPTMFQRTRYPGDWNKPTELGPYFCRTHGQAAWETLRDLVDDHMRNSEFPEGLREALV